MKTKFEMKRYFIRDCNGKIIGNPFGYKTYTAAETIQNNNLNSLIWSTYVNRTDKTKNQISSICLLSFEEAEVLVDQSYIAFQYKSITDQS